MIYFRTAFSAPFPDYASPAHDGGVRNSPRLTLKMTSGGNGKPPACGLQSSPPAEEEGEEGGASQGEAGADSQLPSFFYCRKIFCTFAITTACINAQQDFLLCFSLGQSSFSFTVCRLLILVFAMHVFVDSMRKIYQDGIISESSAPQTSSMTIMVGLLT